jgi:hypothetical protein
LEDRSRTFNYIDKRGRLIPWIDAQLKDCAPKSDHPNADNFALLVHLKQIVEDGVFDWQPAE